MIICQGSVSQQDKGEISKVHTFSKYSGLRFHDYYSSADKQNNKGLYQVEKKDESRCGKVFGLSNNFTFLIFLHGYGLLVAIVHSNK
jgi:hypothetical protein